MFLIQCETWTSIFLHDVVVDCGVLVGVVLAVDWTMITLGAVVHGSCKAYFVGAKLFVWVVGRVKFVGVDMHHVVITVGQERRAHSQVAGSSLHPWRVDICGDWGR